MSKVISFSEIVVGQTAYIVDLFDNVIKESKVKRVTKAGDNTGNFIFITFENDDQIILEEGYECSVRAIAKNYIYCTNKRDAEEIYKLFS